MAFIPCIAFGPSYNRQDHPPESLGEYLSMLLATYQQQLDPLAYWNIPWSPLWSTLLAALPVVVLFWCLVPLRMLAPKAGLMGSIAAILVAIVVFRMPTVQALASFGSGAAFGLLPVGWTIFNAM